MRLCLLTLQAVNLWSPACPKIFVTVSWTWQGNTIEARLNISNFLACIILGEREREGVRYSNAFKKKRKRRKKKTSCARNSTSTWQSVISLRLNGTGLIPFQAWLSPLYFMFGRDLLTNVITSSRTTLTKYNIIFPEIKNRRYRLKSPIAKSTHIEFLTCRLYGDLLWKSLQKHQKI